MYRAASIRVNTNSCGLEFGIAAWEGIEGRRGDGFDCC